MGACKYFYKQGDSELEIGNDIKLIDFLLERGEAVFNSDIVFDGTVRDAKLLRLFEVIKEARNLQAEIEEDADELNNELEHHKVKGENIIGVTGFLKGLYNSKGRLLFPEFRDESYWSNTKERWKDPNNYTEEEKEILFEKVNGVYVVDQSIPFEVKKNKITERWAAQAAIGTNIHKVMLIFFSYKKKETVKKTYNKTDELILQDVLNDPDINLDYINEETIKLLIQFGRQIVAKFGPDANYFPEFQVSAKTSLMNESGDQQTLLGIIDLLILDKNGKVHVVDYKTSPLDYISYPDSKKLTFKYQMATYSRLLNINGISDAGTSVYVAPIKLHNLRQDSSNNYVYDGVSWLDKLFESISVLNHVEMMNNIDEFLPQPVKVDIVPEKVLEGELKFMSTFFPNYAYGKQYTDLEISKILKGCVEFDKETKHFVYTPKSGGNSISAKTEEKLFEKVKKAFNNNTSRRKDLTIEMKNRLSLVFDSINNPEEDEFGGVPRIEPFSSKLLDGDYGDINWLNKHFSKYFSKGWKISESDMALDFLGVIILENTLTNLVDIVRIVSSDLTQRVKLNKGKYITGALLADIVEDLRPNSLMLDSIVANVEYMDTMFIMNQYAARFKGKTIGEVQVINPTFNTSVQATNELLLYTWSSLMKLDKSFDDNFDKKSDNKILMAAYWDLCKHRFLEILQNERLSTYLKEKWEVFRPIVAKIELDDLDFYDDVQHKRKLLIQLKESMEKQWPGIQYLKDYDYVKNPEVGVYQTVILAIGEADEIRLKQTYQDRSNYLDSANILVNGILGLELDNPGNLAEENLNNITKLVMQVYLNVKDFFHNYQPDLRKELTEFKEGMGFSELKEKTFGNQASLYLNMIYTDPDNGNLLLKNPWKNDHEEPLNSHEVKFLKYFLTEINKDRVPYLSGKELEKARMDSKGEYFYLPLARGTTTSSIAVKGLLPALKDRVMRWAPKNIVSDEKEASGNIFSQEEEKRIRDGNLFQMTNIFNKGYSDERLEIINQQAEGLAHWETNLETLLLKHKFAYVTQQYMDEIFPDIQAIMMHLVVSASHQNTDFPHLKLYVENYIKSKIFNKTIDDPKFDTMAAYSKKLMAFASWIALAFNPKLLYQGIEGIWKDVSLFIRKPDGTYNFSFGNLKDAFLSTLPEMVDMSSGKSKWEQLNDLYGLNDRDMNVFIDRIKSDNSGIYGAFERISFKFASRPDFYNRATIFGAQMRGDGCWDAHVMENGKLVYKMELDARFKEFWTNDKSDPDKYNSQKALYIAMAKLMEKEKVRNADGTLFTMKDPKTGKYNELPKAYTAQQSDGYKDVADSIYGYYSHEKKALIQSHNIGAMIMQMNTYWSAKKNQYLAPGSIKLQGKMEHYSETRTDESGHTRLVYYYIDELGNIFDEDEMKKTGKKGIPYYAWKGLFQEGILVTVALLFNFLNGSFKENVMHIWNNPDKELRRVYRANLGLLFYDLFMFLVMGQIVAGGLQENAKEYSKKTNNPIAAIAVNYGASIFKQSFTDFFALQSILGRGTNWTPFALSRTSSLWKSWWNVCFGDGKAVTALLNSFGATRILKPGWEVIN